MLPWIQHRWTGLCLLVAALATLMLFLYGFFPLKYHSGRMSHMDDLPNFIEGVSIDGQQVYSSGENSVVLMVIDGLRYDFVTEEYMPYTGQLLKNKSACIYVSVAEPPTVTMPRIKSPERKKEKAQWRRTINFWRDIFAMMTGSVSTFADVALNFGAPAVRGDSVLRVANARGRRTVMYGDDTWLRLFPGLWSEYDGTTSFYVTDYTEVDNNVTRHLDKVLTPNEKKKPTFDFLVLHYLGLDHIGHLEGARSPKIKPKLREMDEIVKKIFSAMQTWDRNGVLIVCGDHGMRDAGGHGGATPSEVLVPLVLARSSDFECPHPLGPGPTVAQVDVAPSVAWLLGAPPPGDSGGRLLPALLPQDPRQHLYLLHVLSSHAVKQDIPTNTEFYKQFQRAEQQFAHYLATGQQSAAKIAKEFYEESLAKMSEYLTQTKTEFDLFAIGVAIVLLYAIAISLLLVTLYSLQPDTRRKTSITSRSHQRSNIGSMIAFLVIFCICSAILITSCFITETKSQLCNFESFWILGLFAASSMFTITYFLIKTGIERIKDLSLLNELNAIDMLLIGATLFHCWSFFGTSFIEEEHMTWYFFWNTLMFFVLVRTVVILLMYLSKKLTGATEVQEKPELQQRMSAVGVGILPKWVLLIALHRYLRTMNQTGDRWLFLPDTADWLNAPENVFYLQAHLVVGTIGTLVICLRNLRFLNNVKHIQSMLTIAAVVCVLCYRIASNTLETPIDDIKTWDPVKIVDVFWAILIAQFLLEIVSYIGILKSCGLQPTRNNQSANKFEYSKPKAKSEDYFYDNLMEEPWNVEEVKLNLVRGLSHLMLNDLMLIVCLLMRPHNVVMVPSVFVTCVLTSQCMDHKLLDSKSGKKTEVADILSRTLVHMWIGILFFFYQGNSNSLSSVDLGSGYVGLREYCPVRVALRMGLHAYAGPAIAGAALFATIARHSETWDTYLQAIWRSTNILAAHRVYCVVVYCVIATIFRDHLFVWSVFSPKLLYDFVATIFSLQALATIAQLQFLAHTTNYLARMFTYKSRL
ncbi:GPI ethanolamine phosphate transferase 2 isoform X1 [Spodoptera frugiperda]|uniref:GPI ethanolamine phosphate transferase 2 isoform X1 n=1 Tax=Spodoptera frugiperda TaxID=7108 RepID=A0A9R0EU20_SPOFR|nr:GPI ethanolamine phosphate transferase 2 isoform X1 [Spodoptera frugiperda]